MGNNRMNDSSNDKNNSMNKRSNELKNVELSQRVLRAMDLYDPYYEQQKQEEPFDPPFDAMNRNNRHNRSIKEHESRATDLETRLESFKDYTSSSKQQQQYDQDHFGDSFNEYS